MITDYPFFSTTLNYWGLTTPIAQWAAAASTVAGIYKGAPEVLRGWRALHYTLSKNEFVKSAMLEKLDIQEVPNNRNGNLEKRMKNLKRRGGLWASVFVYTGVTILTANGMKSGIKHNDDGGLEELKRIINFAAQKRESTFEKSMREGEGGWDFAADLSFE